ncbi:MAG: anthranilate synthase component I family protein [Desulfurobacteriaceae bacterium]
MKVTVHPFVDPMDLFLSLAEKGYPVKLFLDSASVNPKTGRYSFIAVGFEEELVLRDREGCFDLLSQALDRFSARYGVELPYGLFGYVSYDANRFIENVPSPRIDDLEMPDLHFILPLNLFIFDNVEKRLYQVSIEKPLPTDIVPYRGKGYRSAFLGFNMDRDYFYSAVRKIKDYIASGDTFQVNFSQRLVFSFEGSFVDLYRELRRINPSPFSFFFELGDFVAVSCSPERLVRRKGSLVETRPIAGTRRRGRTLEEDRRLSEELILSEKERAEHVMLVDLERNDLGKVCRYGTVEVDELMVREYYSHVVHIVSNIRGELRKGVGSVDVLKALFPGGTITGAPKVRTMEIIAELEPTWRGLYTGSVGYFGFNGEMDFNIVIRTLLFREGRGFLQVGAGIVWDSVPEREYAETLHKGRALLESLGVEL